MLRVNRRGQELRRAQEQSSRPSSPGRKKAGGRHPAFQLSAWRACQGQSRHWAQVWLRSEGQQQRGP